MARIDHPFQPVGYGAFKIGRNEGTKYASAYDLPDAAEVDRLLNAVLDLGINYIDTAPAYGLSEERIGQAISHRRGEFFLSTKVGETFDRGGSTYDFSDLAVRASVDRSRKRLRTQRLDLVFLHAPREDLAVVTGSDAPATLLGLRDRGDIEAVGFSGYTEAALRSALAWADAIMVEYHPGDRSLEQVIAEAGKQGVAVMVKKPLASGRLRPEQALPFVFANPAVTSALVGSLRLDHLRENLRIGLEVRPSCRAERSAPTSTGGDAS